VVLYVQKQTRGNSKTEKKGTEKMKAIKNQIWNKSDIYFIRLTTALVAITAAAYMIKMYF